MKEQSELEQVLTSLSIATGLEVCFYDLGFLTSNLSETQLHEDLLKHCSPFCMAVKQKPEAHQQCIKNEYARIQMAFKTDGPFIHSCHAGLTDMIVPVRLGERAIGAIFIGQAWMPPAAEQEANLSRLSQEFQLNQASLRRAADKNNYTTKERLKALYPLVLSICKYWELKERVFLKTTSSDSLLSDLSRPRVCDISTRFLDTMRSTHPSIQKSLEVLRGSHWDEISLPEIASKAGLSPSHFSRLFRTNTNMTWRECITRCRLETVLFLSKRTTFSITQIAEILAYDSPASLMRMVKRETGMSILALKSVQPMGWLLNPDSSKSDY
ncbi:PocR ligand-binding domain-containing protein [Coraliomargarita sp. SDUM461004]|uniref:PocR ligand-binding domain-containing protein n=1 Tax=Thalassobacterium sedimentorum TaxID=3041258 RepID=A0ABU1AJ32_9BACT|nr:PocR ligand-binding domain-containing protein [Coraliomargarita sp. SDUM461004]MDQ8194805.1 PocR ligand-binding domain-containing protein [Coraliomargarita sp. SDUM461004]